MKTSCQFFIFLFSQICQLSSATAVCRDVKVENISIVLFEGKLVMMLMEEGVGFDAFCGDEVGVIMQGVETPIAKYSRKSLDILLDVDVCKEHAFQLIVLEHSFPTKVTRSPWIAYSPPDWFVTDQSITPSYEILWDSRAVRIQWWQNVVLHQSFLECLIYVEFLAHDGTLIHSVLNSDELVPVELKVDLCSVETMEVKYTLVGKEGSRQRFSKILQISAGQLAPQKLDLQLNNGTISMESDIILLCFNADFLLHKNGTILFSIKNQNLEKTQEVRISNFEEEDYCGNITIDSRLQNKGNGSKNYHFTQLLQTECPPVLRAGMTSDSALDIFGVLMGVTLFIVTSLTCAIVIRLKHKVKILFPQ